MTYIVVSTVTGGPDNWTAHETQVEALREYERKLHADDTHSASICGVIQSTDFSPMPDLLAIARAALKAQLEGPDVNPYEIARKALLAIGEG